MRSAERDSVYPPVFRALLFARRAGRSQRSVPESHLGKLADPRVISLLARTLLAAGESEARKTDGLAARLARVADDNAEKTRQLYASKNA